MVKKTKSYISNIFFVAFHKHCSNKSVTQIIHSITVSVYYSMKDDLVNAGAIYRDLPSVIDDNLVTTAHYKDLGPWMRSIIKLYNNQFSHGNQTNKILSI